MSQRGGDLEQVKAAEELKREKIELAKIAESLPTLPVFIKAGITTTLGYGKNDPKGNLKQLRNYKQELLNYFKKKHKNKTNMKNYTLNAFLKYEANQRLKKISGMAGGKRKTRKSKKSRRVTRRRR